MKKCLVGCLVLMWALLAMAQLQGLPVGGGAGKMAPNAMEASVGAVLGDDVGLYGGRMIFPLTDGFAVFGDAGAVDLDASGVRLGWSLQGGGLLTFPLDLPVDVGIRATVGYGMVEYKGGPGDTRWLNATAGLLTSKTFDILTPYALLGVHYMDTEVDPGDSAKVNDDQTDPMAAAGLMVTVGEFWSLYGEVAYIDDPYGVVGVRVPF